MTALHGAIKRLLSQSKNRFFFRWFSIPRAVVLVGRRDYGLLVFFSVLLCCNLPSLSRPFVLPRSVDSGVVSPREHVKRPRHSRAVIFSGTASSTCFTTLDDFSRRTKHFHLRGWIYMSDIIIPNSRMYEGGIVEKFIGELFDSFKKTCSEIDDIFHSRLDVIMYLDDHRRKLSNAIRGRRFLVVVDDVWDDIFPVWNKLKFVLNAGAPGSVVLLTTELHSVATYVATMGPIVLDGLQEEHFWCLFKLHAFSGLQDKSSVFLDLEPIGRRISERLHGLPLATKIVGRSLSIKYDKRHWEEVSKSPWWNITKTAGGEEILASLGVSFYNLSAPHRRCFVYCSIFPRNYVFEMDRLIEMWIAHGFIPVNDSENIMAESEQGRKWFEELVDRSYLQPTVWKDRYIVHDAIRDFSVAAASSEYFILSNSMRHVPQFLHHLSIDKDDLDVYCGDYDNKDLRTLLAFGHHRLGRTQDNLCDILKLSTCLRVLDLSHTLIGTPKVKFLSSIGGLLHLRYLDLSHTGISELPETFRFLCHLQVLDLRGCRFKVLPRKMNRLINLRHLRAHAHTISLIYGIGRLTRLQELREFTVIPTDGHRISELRDMKSISGSLCISNLNVLTDREEALQASLCEKEQLRALHLKWNAVLLHTKTGDSSKTRQIKSNFSGNPNLAREILGAMSLLSISRAK